MNKIFVLIIGMMILLWGECLAHVLNDPTRPPANIQGKVVVSPALFALNAIVIGKDRRFAIINGKYLKVGDEILGQHVTFISENTVQLEGPNGKIVLFLFGKPIKYSQSQLGCEGLWNICPNEG